MIRDRITDGYIRWLLDLACGRRFSKQVSYRKLLLHLHSIEFTYILPMDENRAEDGKDLRWRFVLTHGYEDDQDRVLDILDGPCSVLEMMLALSIRVEEETMDDPAIGDRTGQWFWGMLVNLGLGSMHDSRFDAEHVDDIIDRFLERDYGYDGEGGLFTVRHCDRDMRDIEIWNQFNMYLNSII